nr:MFS transporter [Streptomyces tsukubensis]
MVVRLDPGAAPRRPRAARTVRRGGRACQGPADAARPAQGAVRAVWSANAAMLVCGGAMMSMWYLMTLYAQNALGYTPLHAGLALIPSSLSVVLGSKNAPRVMRRIGARNTAVIGAAVAAVGFLWQSAMTVDSGFATGILGPGILMMLGAGLSGTPLAALGTSGAAPGDAGLVSGMINTSRTMGGALGLAALSTVAAARTAGSTTPEALTEGYALAFRVSGFALIGGVLLMLVSLPRSGQAARRAEGG